MVMVPIGDEFMTAVLGTVVHAVPTTMARPSERPAVCGVFPACLAATMAPVIPLFNTDARQAAVVLPWPCPARPGPGYTRCRECWEATGRRRIHHAWRDWDEDGVKITPSLAHLYVQRRRVKGWRMPPGVISCTRRSRWGNPFRVGRDMGFSTWHVERDGDFFAENLPTKAEAIREAVDLYDAHTGTFGLLEPDAGEIEALAGRLLSCYCKPGTPCHVQDVLLPLANPDIPRRTPA